MIYSLLVLSFAVLTSAERNIQLVTSDLSHGGRVIDNVKGRWTQTLKFLGAEANIDAEYDRKTREDFLSQATLSGKLDDVSYEVKTSFKDTHELTLSADTKDGTNVEMVADNKAGLTKLTASRGVKVQGKECNIEASHARQSAESKLKLSSLLGHGVSGSATWTVGSKPDAAEYELEYETELTNGRSVSAKLNPKDGSGDITYEDSKTLDATITASMDLGGKPKVTVQRAWAF
jgi:hypothetical protein